VNPFAKLLRDLPDTDKRKLGAGKVPYSDHEAGIGAFNLRSAVEPETGDHIADDHKGAKAGIKPFSVETCLGYWVPAAKATAFEGKLFEAGRSKRRRLLKLRAAVKRLGQQVLEQRFCRYVAAIERLLDKKHIVHERPFTKAGYLDLFRRFMDRVRGQLADEVYLSRVCEPFTSGPMPEIWDDSEASREFIASFFDYLAYVASLPGNKSKVPAQILDRIGLVFRLLVAHRSSSTTEPSAARTQICDSRPPSDRNNVPWLVSFACALSAFFPDRR
jgi:hypothetical protein